MAACRGLVPDVIGDCGGKKLVFVGKNKVYLAVFLKKKSTFVHFFSERKFEIPLEAVVL